MEEKLIAPEYSENYLGRRAFFFSEKDVRTLRDIAVLRKIGFSISDIRTIQNDPQQSAGIIDGLRRRIEAAVAEKQACLDALNTLDEHVVYTLSDLASALQRPVEKTPLPQEDSRVTLRSALRRFGSILLKTLRFCLVAFFLFVPFSWLSVIMAQNGRPVYQYPHAVCPEYYLWILSPALLMLLVLVIDRVLLSLKRWMFIMTYVLCAVLMFFSFMAMFALCDMESLTKDIADYRSLDADCSAIGDSFYEDLFPAYPQNDPSPADNRWDASYLYRQYVVKGKMTEYEWGKTRYKGDVVETVYAEWSLAPDRFDAEIARVDALFSIYLSDGDRYRQETVQQGKWVILFRYQGNGPFTEETGLTYRYYLFAYRPEDYRVRYLLCNFRGEEANHPEWLHTEVPFEQPYYLALDW